MLSGSSATVTPRSEGAAVLARARGSRAAADAAEAEVLAAAVEWAHLHPALGSQGCTIVSDRGEDTGITIAGPGAPKVSEFAVIELATALGMSDVAGRAVVGQALELVHRLPRVWTRVAAGDLAPWRARRIAEQTIVLSVEAASFVDAQVAAFAHKIGPAATQRLVEEAIARFMPDLAQKLREDAADGRHFDIEHGQVSFEGTSRVHGELDLADALDLEAAVSAGAAQLAALGSEDPLDVRRAKAVGEIARTQLALDLAADSSDTSADTSGGATAEAEGGVAPAARPGRSKRRQVILYVHLSADAGTTADTARGGLHLARLENRGPHLLTIETIREWLAAEGTSIRVQPVIDLNENLSATSHELPDRMREQATLRDQSCIFPHCTRPARGCDDEHCVPFDSGGPTSSWNVAKVCRKHHRAKTHGGWSYVIIRPGTYLWTSPHGYRYLRDPSGTVDRNPPDQ